jgi:hypothetical protein
MVLRVVNGTTYSVEAIPRQRSGTPTSGVMQAGWLWFIQAYMLADIVVAIPAVDLAVEAVA